MGCGRPNAIWPGVARCAGLLGLTGVLRPLPSALPLRFVLSASWRMKSPPRCGELICGGTGRQRRAETGEQLARPANRLEKAPDILPSRSVTCNSAMNRAPCRTRTAVDTATHPEPVQRRSHHRATGGEWLAYDWWRTAVDRMESRLQRVHMMCAAPFCWKYARVHA